MSSPHGRFASFEVSQHLSNMHAMNFLDRLHFDDKLSFDHDVETNALPIGSPRYSIEIRRSF